MSRAKYLNYPLQSSREEKGNSLLLYPKNFSRVKYLLVEMHNLFYALRRFSLLLIYKRE